MGLLTRLGTGGVACAAFLYVLGRPAVAPAMDVITEAQAKAALLYNLGSFVAWPRVDGHDAGVLAIGVVGEAAVLDALNPLQGRVVSGRAITAVVVSQDDDPRQCDILYFGDDQRGADTLMRRLGSAPVLTVGDDPGFTQTGGMVRIYFDGARLRFEINLSNVRRTKLDISSKLLGLAHVVNSDGVQH